tara:strand:+ start:586 stop:738 length:153 start_codon:yes stop_codon:yes gene_type:complete
MLQAKERNSTEFLASIIVEEFPHYEILVRRLNDSLDGGNRWYKRDNVIIA